MIPKWVAENWVGVLIDIKDEPFTGLHYRVPGWKCKHCGVSIGSATEPPKTCPKCNHSSEQIAREENA